MALSLSPGNVVHNRRDSPVPLIVAAVLALAINLLLWSSGAVLLRQPGHALQRKLPRLPQNQLRTHHRITLGSDRSYTASVAWVSYDAFQKLLARKSRTEQPALQKKARPVKHAPPRLRPTPPAPNVRAARQPSAPPAAAIPHAPAARQTHRADRGLEQTPDAGRAPFADRPRPKAHQPPAPPRQAAVTEVAPAARTAHKTKKPQRHAAVTSAARPTDAPRVDRESPPTAFIDSPHEVRPGRVITGPGIEIKTAVPDFSAITLASSVPRNPKAAITFNKDGYVIDARITLSSDYPNVDSAILQSLYAWRATGQRLKAIGKPFIIHVHLLLLNH